MNTEEKLRVEINELKEILSLALWHIRQMRPGASDELEGAMDKLKEDYQ